MTVGRKYIGGSIRVHLEPDDERAVRQLAHNRKTQVSPMLRKVIKRWLRDVWPQREES